MPHKTPARLTSFFQGIRKNSPSLKMHHIFGKVSRIAVGCLEVSLFFLCISVSARTEHRPLPDFGVVMNVDGDLAFPSEDPAVSERLLRADVDATAATGIGTLVFSVACGSDVLNYPTKVGSSVGWRKTKYEDTNETWRIRTTKARSCIAAGMDAVNIVADQAKKNGMFFFPSLRMNDSHFMTDPKNYPLTGEFWMKHGHRLRIKDSPLAWAKSYGNLFDYTHPEVREYRLAVVKEVIERNKKLIDGFELDFNRVQVFFPKGKAEAGMPLITELVREVRQMLDRLSKEQGRPMYLFVRIPPAEESCRWAGLDVDTWMKEGLVDLVTPSQLMTLAHDMPIQEMTRKAKQYGVKIYPTLLPRTSFRVSLEPSGSNCGMDGDLGRAATLAETLGAAANYRQMGVDGFYLFNYYGHTAGRRPYADVMYALIATLRRNKPDAADKVFAITKTYYNDDKQPSYAYVKQLPRAVSGRKDFTLLVGEIPSEVAFDPLTCVLRLGLGSYEGTPPAIAMNGVMLSPAIDKPHTLKRRGGDIADRSLVYAINTPDILKQGENTITIQTGVAMIIITDIEIGIAYKNQLSRLVFEGTASAPESIKSSSSSLK